jgi:hypothetical protein
MVNVLGIPKLWAAAIWRRFRSHPRVVAGGVLDPAALDGMALLDGHETGGALLLDEAAPADAVADAGDGWTVEVRAGSRCVVARCKDIHPAESVYELAANAAQRSLDLFSVRNVGNLHILHAEDEHLLWWAENGRRIIRVFGVATLKMDVPPVRVRVTDASGRERPTPPEPEVAWDPSFRYFRLAQVSDEVFDAFRNLYLALESILSGWRPPNQGEREFDWLLRALREAETDGLNLVPFAPDGSTDPAEDIRAELYGDVRTATFHAKSGRTTLLPLDAVDRGRVLDALSRLARLYLALAQHILGQRRPEGGVALGGFELSVGRVVDQFEVNVTDDPARADASDTVANPGGGTIIPMRSRPSPEFDERFLRTVAGEARVEDLGALTHLAGVVALHRPDGQLASFSQLEGRLTLGGFDTLQAVMGVRGVNVRQPRSRYGM